MPSTNKTSLGLNDWIGSDKPQRTDFNRDNEIINHEIVQVKAGMAKKPSPLPKEGNIAVFTGSGDLKDGGVAPDLFRGIVSNVDPVTETGVYKLASSSGNNDIPAGTSYSTLLVLRSNDTMAQIIVTYTGKRMIVRGGRVANGAPIWSSWWDVAEKPASTSVNAQMQAAVMALSSEATALSDEQALTMPNMLPDWKSGESCKTGQIRRYAEKLYRCLQDHTSQDDWAPDQAAGLWAQVSDPAQEWPEWAQPQGAHDAYAQGAGVSHSGKHWVSLADGNVWEPGAQGSESLWREEL